MLYILRPNSHWNRFCRFLPNLFPGLFRPFMFLIIYVYMVLVEPKAVHHRLVIALSVAFEEEAVYGWLWHGALAGPITCVASLVRSEWTTATEETVFREAPL